MSGMRACCVYGGSPIKDQFDDMSGGVHIIVATPGRLLDMYERKRLSLLRIQFLIMDEVSSRPFALKKNNRSKWFFGLASVSYKSKIYYFSKSFFLVCAVEWTFFSVDFWPIAGGKFSINI